VPADRALFSEMARIFTASPADATAMRVQIWAAPPGQTVRVWMTPAGGGRTLWVRIPQDGFDTIAPVATTIGPNGRLEGDIPAAAFEAGAVNGGYEALVLSAPTLQRSASTVQHLCPLPNCVVTSGFEVAREHPILGGRKPHLAVDYRASEGTPVTATAAGVVERSYTSTQGLGEAIIIRHDDGSATLYAHLQRRDVFLGDLVDAREQIGYSGETGRADGPHLHFEMVRGGPLPGGDRVDPVLYIVLPTYTVRVEAVQENADALIWGTQNAIQWNGSIRAHFGEYAPGVATITQVAAGLHMLRIGYSGGIWPQIFPGGYFVVAAIEGGTWAAVDPSNPVDTPTSDVFSLAPNWYPNLVNTPEGFVWKTFTVTVP
jgi:hypothetical protein